MRTFLTTLQLVAGIALAAPSRGESFVSNARLSDFLTPGVPNWISKDNRADVVPSKKAPRIIVIYENQPGWCGSGGCDLDIIAQDTRGLHIIGHETIVWDPILLLRRDSTGFPVFGVWRQGGGIRGSYCDQLSFNGRKYVVKMARRWSGKHAPCSNSRQVLIK